MTGYSLCPHWAPRWREGQLHFRDQASLYAGGRCLQSKFRQLPSWRDTRQGGSNLDELYSLGSTSSPWRRQHRTDEPDHTLSDCFSLRLNSHYRYHRRRARQRALADTAFKFSKKHSLLISDSFLAVRARAALLPMTTVDVSQSDIIDGVMEC